MLQIFCNDHFFDLIAPVFSFFKSFVKDITYSKMYDLLSMCVIVKSVCAYSDDNSFAMKNGLEQHIRFFLAEKPLKSQLSGLFE